MCVHVCMYSVYVCMYIYVCTCMCVHVCIYMYVFTVYMYVCTKAGMNSQYQIRSFVKKSFEGSHVFLILFINVALTWIGYRKPPKLHYCFIMSTNLVPVAVSTRI